MWAAVIMVAGYIVALENWRKKHASRNKREGTYTNRRAKKKLKAKS